MIVLEGEDAAPPAKPKKKRRRLKPTHAVMLGDKDVPGVDQGFRCFRLLKTGTKWVYLLETGSDPQRVRKCLKELWAQLERKGKRL